MPTATTTRHGNSFADLLRKSRKRAGLNQQQLADYLAESPKRISKWETGVSDPPGDPAFYESLRNVPGFTESDISLLQEAREVDESARVLRKRRVVIEDDEVVLEDSVVTALADFVQKLIEERTKAQQKITEAIKRKGIFGKPNKRDVTRAEAGKANRDREILTAQHLADWEKHTASGEKYVWDVIASMQAIDDALHDEPKPIEQTLTKFGMKILTEVYAETLTRMSAAGLAEIAWAPTQATPVTFPAAEEESEEPSAEYLPDTDDDDIISPPIPHEVVEHDDHLTEHISDLESQAKLWSEDKQRASHYPHTSVPEHAPRLVGEGKFQQLPKKGDVYEKGQTSKTGTPEASAGKTYEVVATLRQVAEKTGIERDEILTTRDIEDEYNINKKLVHEYTRRGREGRPHLTPLSVRLSGGRGGQLLFRREDIERLVANPPKPGPPRK